MNTKPPQVGERGPNGDARIKFHLHGVERELPGLEFSGIIDTGFSGFIQLPFTQAISLGLSGESTITLTLANGDRIVNFAARAQATLGGDTSEGMVILAPQKSSVLIGMDFLRRFNRALVISRNLGIVLLDENTFSDLAQAPNDGSNGLDDSDESFEKDA